MAAMSAVSLWREMMVSGLASMPWGSLRATPIRWSPISRPRLRVILPSALNEILYQP
jgi:hypothetical protein